MRVHEHVNAWKHRCQQHVDGHTWDAGSEPTDVAHGIVSTRRMGRGPREVILLLLNRMSELVRRECRSLTGRDCHGPRADWAARGTVAHGYCSVAAQLRFSPRLETERELD